MIAIKKCENVAKESFIFLNHTLAFYVLKMGKKKIWSSPWI